VNPYLEQARNLGANLATEEFEKQAFLGAAMSALRPLGFLAGMSGRFGSPGSMLYRATNPHIGSALGFGALGAAGEDEGNRLHGFVQGAASGLLFSGGMGLGARLGKRLLAPMSRTGSSTSKAFYGGLGLSRGQVNRLQRIQSQNKRINRLSNSGNPNALGRRRFSSKKDLDTYISGLRQSNQARYNKLLEGMTSGQRAAIKSVRSAKNIGGIIGGMGLGMGLSHSLPAYLTPDLRTSSGSMFNPYNSGH
tara:strand:+ start:3285 stop:4034 length:750 start_codon:yes stop_codon:yes gene_type:complete